MRSAPSQIIVTSVRVPAALLQDFKRVAEAEHRSVSQQMRHLMAEAVTSLHAAEREGEHEEAAS